MVKSFNDLAYDLRDFIVDKHANYRGLKHMSMQRYNNLSINMNSKRFSQQHVIVKIGISEGVFTFPYVNKLDGGLGMDERFVMQWIGNDNTIQVLTEHWKTIKLQELEQDSDK